MANRLVRWNCFDVASFFQFTIMVLAVPAVLYVIQIISCFLAEKSELLSASYMELLFTACFVALHTGTCCRAGTFS